MSTGELWKIRFILQGRFSDNKRMRQGTRWAFMCETVVFLTSRAFKRSNSNFVFSLSSSVLLLSLLESSSTTVWIFSMPSLHFLLSSDSFSWNDFLKCHYSQVEMKLTMQVSSNLPCIWMKKRQSKLRLTELNKWSHEGLIKHAAMPVLQSVCTNELLHLLKIL